MKTPGRQVVEIGFRPVVNEAIEAFKRSLATGEDLGDVFQKDAEQGRRSLLEAAERRASEARGQGGR